MTTLFRGYRNLIRNVAFYRLFTTWIQLKLFAVQFTPDPQSLTSKEFSHHFFVRVINAAYNCNSNIMRCTLSLFAKVNLIMLFLLKRQQNIEKKYVKNKRTSMVLYCSFLISFITSFDLLNDIQNNNIIFVQTNVFGELYAFCVQSCLII